jgi:hypothetical protein
MNRLILYFLLLFILAACMPADLNAPSYDPYLDAEMGKMAIARSSAAIQATNEAQQRQMAQATLQAAEEEHKTEQEVRRIQAEIEGTQAAVSAQSTQAAIAFAQDLATHQAEATANAFVLAQTPAAATQTALERQIRVDEAKEQRAKVMTWAIPLAMGLGILFVAWKAGNFIDWRAEIMRRNNAARESRDGTLIWVWNPEIEDECWVPLRDVPSVRRLPSGSGSDFGSAPAVEFSPGRVTATSPAQNGDARKLAIKLVKDSISKGSADGNMIMSWHNLAGWTSSRWSEAVRFLKDKKAVRTVDRVGTFIEYDSLADLLYALETNQLSPAPNA